MYVFVRRIVYVLAFMLSFYAMSAIDYERFLKKNHVQQARILYWLIVIALAYTTANFVIAICLPFY